MAITRLTTVSSDVGTTGTSQTFEHTVDSGTDLLVVFVAESTSSTGATWNGDAMTSGGVYTDNGRGLQMWYRISPTATTANVIVSWGSNTKHCIVAYNLSGVDTGDPIGNTNTGSASGTSISTDVITAITADWVVDGIYVEATNQALEPGADQVEIADLFNADDVNGGFSSEPGEGTRTMSWSWGTSSTARILAVGLNAAAVAGGGVSSDNSWLLMGV